MKKQDAQDKPELPPMSPQVQLLYDIMEIIESANPVSLEDRAKELLALAESGVDLEAEHRERMKKAQSNPNISCVFDGEVFRLTIKQGDDE